MIEEILLESAPKIPKDSYYWVKKGKRGKYVCIIFHDDLDGICSAIIMKNWLEDRGFKVESYAVINYTDTWNSLKLDDTLINIALDYADDSPNIDIYMDHHGSFTEEERVNQKKKSIKTKTGSAAEGIALQLGIPFPKELKDWIDMIDSAKYIDYNVDITDILNFDLKSIIDSKENVKLKFASIFNQLLKRSDYKTFIEVVNSSNTGPSIYNIFRLFKIYYPKNNINWKTGEEMDFLSDSKNRINTMKTKIRGKKEHKKIYTDFSDFWNDFSINNNNYERVLSLINYQIIGNIMFVPSGTWANALRSKSIYFQDLDNGNLPKNTKCNFVLLQYGNTLQIADLHTPLKNYNDDEYPILKNGYIMNDLGKYMNYLVDNFKNYLDYNDSKILSGGHLGIGSISNIFGDCDKKGFELSYIDLFKNKIISDLSDIKWPLTVKWKNEKNSTSNNININKKMVKTLNVRNEVDVKTTLREEKIITNYIKNNELDQLNENDFKNKTNKKIISLLKKLNFDIQDIGKWLTKDNISKLWFKYKKYDILNSKKVGNYMYDNEFFDKFVNEFNLYNLYTEDSDSELKKETKRLLLLIGNIVRGY
jgi:hypothetical protein